MFEFQVIESSSAGNCAFFNYNGNCALIDAGIGIRKIEKFLSSRGMGLSDIKAVFITHEHSDHCKGLQSFYKYPHIEIFANIPTAEAIKSSVPRTKQLNWKCFRTGDIFDFMGLRINPFSIPHDTSDAVGYFFETDCLNTVWLTDLGKVTTLAASMARQAEVLVLESNFCPQMLDASDRPYKLKSRIKGSQGHLSNEDAINLLSTLDPQRVRKIYLAHISRECNSLSKIGELISTLPDTLRDSIEIVSPVEGLSSVFRIE